MKKGDELQLQAMALRVREHIVRMAADGGCFIGSALSCVDLLVYLYAKYLNIDPRDPDNPDRDYLFLSKGHAVPALYGTLAEIGWLEQRRLANHLRACDTLYWHPNQAVPGIEFHSGSLGHMLAVAVGVAMDCKLRGQANRIVVITGDGELNEGSNWEACLLAGVRHLDNLTIVVDRNRLQANVRTEELVPLEPLGQKLAAFGCCPVRVNGHDLADLERVFTRVPLTRDKPTGVIAETVRGRGIPSIEGRADRWFCDLSPAEAEQLLKELRR